MLQLLTRHQNKWQHGSKTPLQAVGAHTAFRRQVHPRCCRICAFRRRYNDDTCSPLQYHTIPNPPVVHLSFSPRKPLILFISTVLPFPEMLSAVEIISCIGFVHFFFYRVVSLSKYYAVFFIYSKHQSFGGHMHCKYLSLHQLPFAVYQTTPRHSSFSQLLRSS